MKRTKFSGGLSRYWWIPLIYGLICIALGIWTICSPFSSLPVLAYAFAIGLLIAGVLDFAFSISGARYNPQWGWGIALGILDLVAGIWLLTLPEGMLTVTFMYIIGIWILVAAINSIAETCVVSDMSAGWLVWSILLLIATVVLAVYFLFTPLLGGIAVWLWIGISLICYGTYRMMVAGRVKTLRDATDGLL